PLGLIEKYSADGVRIGMLLSSPAGNDLLFDEKLCEQGRNFTNKIWNAYRLVQGWQIDDSPETIQLGKEKNTFAIDWFSSKFKAQVAELHDHFDKYRMSDALMTMYKLIWDDFCAWYLEMVKPDYEKPIDKFTYETTIHFLEDLLKVAHPFMPFITEEIWHELKERSVEESLIIASYPAISSFDSELLAKSDVFFELVNYIRNYRNEKQISPKEPLELFIKTENESLFHGFDKVLRKLTNLKDGGFVKEKPENVFQFTIKGDEFFIPLPKILDVAKEKANILKDIEYLKGFLASVQKKLSNEKFVANAPADVLEKERIKQKDAEDKIKSLEETLAMLNLQ
ncbi:MAG: class I tRNA ligase family protein, partial [Cytophagales bacterium]|nr:class I tRNA ligase family protein [Cytophagales bacterium]